MTFFSTISGITVMGVPSEIYTYGTLYWMLCLNGPIVGLINYYIYIPVFYELQLTSVYEVNYLDDLILPTNLIYFTKHKMSKH